LNGVISYAAQTNRGIGIEWCDESVIRMWRADVTDETGDPFFAATRIMSTNTEPRRRWELCVYPMPDEVMVVEFPFTLHFDKLIDFDEYPPAPFAHDETIKAACLATAEKEIEDTVDGPDNRHYVKCLAQSYRADNMSAPRKLVPSTVTPPSIQRFRESIYQRPTVTFNL